MLSKKKKKAPLPPPARSPKQKVQTKLSWPAGVRSPGLAERPQNTGASGETAAPLVPVPVGEPAPIVEALSPGMSPEQPIRWNFCDPQKKRRQRLAAEPGAESGGVSASSPSLLDCMRREALETADAADAAEADEGEMALPMAGLHLRLEDEWADTPARQGDRVHVIGSLRGCGCGGALHWSHLPELLMLQSESPDRCPDAAKELRQELRQASTEDETTLGRAAVPLAPNHGQQARAMGGGVVASEHALTSYTFGLKGTLDAVLSAELDSPGGCGASRALLPFELKTGRRTPSNSNDHQAGQPTPAGRRFVPPSPGGLV
ncbi:hypothetical protein EMIHUDRAFT_207278 [Emiliania huxleyi CCMP1516]|uniref:Fanconi-associated nuclease n=2 Tax=Emiliania huxleyi TaxID=2903 RepID=A0A0D3JF66_EMIH1|nr:hypothetical protein EMIHUDRAFT_207278 [Emiliania huxleyi CCMP1516]EOD22151.1 hypothetical protein EMIHUDRAFT_207278 [Emiliania huxleyi CCMP1516]|eukprot:XP_005774580.1 hypothetical protein EMIHUDRAFT_207278 [Emiliania huxleyi CCMP1516]